MTISGFHGDMTDAPSRRTNILRAATGAFYGFVAGLTFVFVAVFVDIWLYPDLPLGVDWRWFWTRLPFFALGLALVGAVTCWWNDTWPGMLSGAITASTLALLIALFSNNAVGAGTKFMVLLFILVPVAAMMVPISWLLRWLVERHGDAIGPNKSYARVAGLIVLAVFAGALAGFFMKMSNREAAANRHIHSLLQRPLDDTTVLGEVEGIAQHWGRPYKLFSMASETSTVGYDVRVRYEDEYVVKCTLVLYVGRPPLLSGCVSE